MNYWISWYSPCMNPRKRGPRLGDCWCTGTTFGTRKEAQNTYCAWVKAESEEAAWEIVGRTYRVGEHRFCSEKPDDWTPYGDRFQKYSVR